MSSSDSIVLLLFEPFWNLLSMPHLVASERILKQFRLDSELNRDTWNDPSHLVHFYLHSRKTTLQSLWGTFRSYPEVTAISVAMVKLFNSQPKNGKLTVRYYFLSPSKPCPTRNNKTITETKPIEARTYRWNQCTKRCCCLFTVQRMLSKASSMYSSSSAEEIQISVNGLDTG